MIVSEDDPPAGESEAAVGYRLVLPAGWQRITTGDGSQQTVDRFIAQQLREKSGSDHVFAERALREQLTELLGQAEAAGALDIYVFSARIRSLAVFMSFAVSTAFLGTAGDDFDDDEFAELAGYGAAESEFIEGPAGRVFRAVEEIERTAGERAELVAAELGASSDLASYPITGAAAVEFVDQAKQAVASGAVIRSSRVSYLAATPGAPGLYLLLVFSCDYGALAEAQTAMFDAIVATLRWVTK